MGRGQESEIKGQTRNRQIYWASWRNLSNKFGNFLLAIVLIRLLGLTTYGLYAMLWLGLLFALSLHQAFITKPMMTLAIEKTDSDRLAYFNSLWQIQLYGFLLLGGLGIGFCLLPFSYPSCILYFPFMVGITGFYLLQDFLKKTFFINKKYVLPLLIDALLYSILFIGLAILHHLEKINLENILALIVIAYGVSVIVLKFQIPNPKSQNSRETELHHNPQSATRNSQLTTLKTHYHFSYWLLGTSILQWFTGNFFLVVAAGILGTTAVGAVRMAQNLVGLCTILFLAMENIVPAEAAQHFLKKGRIGLVSYLKKSSKQMGSFILVILGGMAVTTKWTIPLLYGSKYVSYSYVIWGYCLLYLFVFIGYPLRYYFRTIRITRPIFIAYVLGGIFSLLAAFPLVRVGGLTGLLFGLITSQILTLIFYFFYIRHINTIPSREVIYSTIK